MANNLLGKLIWDGTCRFKVVKIGGSADNFVDDDTIQEKLGELTAHIQNTLNTAIAELYNTMHVRNTNTDYRVGDIAYSNRLASYCRLQCVKAGTTSNEILSIATPGRMINDGTVRWIVDDVRDSAPVGSLRLSQTILDGYLHCNGAVLNREEFPRLVKFATDYSLFVPEEDAANFPGYFGSGDGETTFTLPDLRNRIPYNTGEDIGSAIEAGLPNITGIFYASYNAPYYNGTVGALYQAGKSGVKQLYGANSGSGGNNIGFDASRSNALYGKAATVQPPAINLYYLIKY